MRIISLTICMLLLCTSVFAVGIDAPDSDEMLNNGIVIVSGTADITAPQNITLAVTSKNISEITDIDALVYFKQQYSDDGTFRFAFELPEGTLPNEYTIRVGSSMMEIPYKTDLVYYTNDSKAALENTILDKTEAELEDIRLIIEEGINKDILGLDFEFYSTLNDKTAVLNMLAALTRGEQDKIPTVFNQKAALAAINEVEADDISILISKLKVNYKEIFGLDDNGYIEKLNGDSKDRLFNYITNTDFSSEADFKTGYREKLALNTVASLQYGYLKDALEYFSEELPGVMEELSKAKNESDILAKISGKYYETAVELKNTIASANANKTPVARPSGGGGGGGGGGGISKIPPVIDSTANVVPPAVPQSAEKHFDDVDEHFWGYKPVMKLAEKEIINGFSDGTFKPNNNITRAELVKIISIAFQLEGESTKVFSDVNESDWYAQSVSRAVANDIVYGYEDNSFKPTAFVTRQDAAVFIYRVLEKLGIDYDNTANSFADQSEIADYALKAANNLRAIGIISGDDNGRFMPKNNCTRAEAAKMIYELMKTGGLIND